MKRLIVLFIVVSISFSLCACEAIDDSVVEENQATTSEKIVTENKSTAAEEKISESTVSKPATAYPSSKSQQSVNDTITEEEEFAVKYLLKFADRFSNPYSIKLHHVWVSNGHVAYKMEVENKLGGTEAITVGNDLYVDNTDEDIEKAYRWIFDFEVLGGSDPGYWRIDKYGSLPALEEGHEIDADKIQSLYEERY